MNRPSAPLHLLFRTVAAAARVSLALAVALLGPSAATADHPPSPLNASAVEGVTIPVSDLAAATRFYTEVLGFEVETRSEMTDEAFSRRMGLADASAAGAVLRLGHDLVELVQFHVPIGRPIPTDSRSNDRWFQHIAIVVADMDRAIAILNAADVSTASVGPQTLPAWNPKAGGISAFYFKDPDGHVLEVIHFPADKAPRWSAVASRDPHRVFLGIDHTAIVVEDTDRSLGYYRDTLGMAQVGDSENYGVEQERLNNVYGAHLRITTLRAPDGPGVELLEYLAPGGGRCYPPDSTPADLWQWHTRIRVAQSDPAPALRAVRAPRISAGPLLPDEPPAPFLVRDPDGHATMIVPGHPLRRPAASTAPVPRVEYTPAAVGIGGIDGFAFSTPLANDGAVTVASSHCHVAQRMSLPRRPRPLEPWTARSPSACGKWRGSATGTTETTVSIDSGNFILATDHSTHTGASMFAHGPRTVSR